MQISVVIPTCDRRARLLSLLANLNTSSYPIHEVIIVDSGKDQLSPAEYAGFKHLNIRYTGSDRSVCIQRNKGIGMAQSPWILLCDDDMELPVDYIKGLVYHINTHADTGAVSGLMLQKIGDEWKSGYALHSARTLWWKYIFQLGIWGEINCRNGSLITSGITEYYKRKGNHISKAGWPVNTDFSGEFVICPVYSLGASLVKKEWLVHSPYDEVLDRHGIGDNYGVIVDFPIPGIHIVNSTVVYHHTEPINRLQRPLQYYRRVLAMDYLARIKPGLKHVRRHRIIWSLTGNLLGFIWAMDGKMIKAGCKAISKIIFNRNPYFIASKKRQKVTEPML